MAIASRSFTLVYASLHKRYYVKTYLYENRQPSHGEISPGFNVIGEQGGREKKKEEGKMKKDERQGEERRKLRCKANPKAKCFLRETIVAKI